MKALPQRLDAILLTVLLLVGTPAWSASLKGVAVPEIVEAEGHALELQGLGLRKKFVFSVYVGALYLTRPSSDPSAAIAADEPKRIALHFLRDVGGDKMKEAFEEGFFNNAQEQLDRLRPRLDAFLVLFDKGVSKGQVVTFTYLPETGVRVSEDAQVRGTIEGRDFMEALWSVWLGEVPADRGLKKGMMGIE